MLCQFSFENYKTFKEEAILDLYAEPIKEHTETLITDKNDNEKFLPIAVIYGPNGAGKSNALEALYYIHLSVLSHVFLFWGVDDRVRTDRELLLRHPVFHKFSPECKKIPTKFDILLRDDIHAFKYQLSTLEGKIYEENLYTKKIDEDDVDILFERKANVIKKGDVIKDVMSEHINDMMPFLSHLEINYKIPIVNKVIKCFLNSDFINFANPLQEARVNIPENNPEIRKKLFKMVQSMGIGIKDAKIIKDLNGQIINIFMIHETKDDTLVEIPLSDESMGTIKIFTFLVRIIDAIEKGKLIVIDELDAKLHPKLLKYIIELFTNPKINKKGAQLLFTSHDVSTMNSDVFRRDEIWFCAMNPDNASNLYSLSSFKKENGKQPRNDENYFKQYLEGRYGADPYFRKIMEW